jgi:glycosyltransferase involved in cell wall biosynthesis
MLTVVLPVAFGPQVWLGGVNYFRNLAKATNTYSAGRFRLVLLTDKPDHFADLDGPNVSVVMCRMLDFRSGPIAFGSRILQRLTHRNPALLSIIRRHGPDLISHGHAGVQSSVPTLPWMPDFQHRALPHLFSAREHAGRESLMKTYARLGHLLLSSESARQDFELYYPSMRHVKVHVLRFPAFGAASGQPIKSLADLQEQHSIPERYIYLPNQFWAHKNHGVVIDALARTSSDLTVVCTGSSSDLRNDKYFSGLMDRVQRAKLESRFRVLGLVEYSDVVALMHHAIAVLNPSLFEGWSTTVEEAKAQGKLMILSSLPVHIEQARQHRARFFPPENADALASLIDEVALSPSIPPPDTGESAIAATLKREQFIDDYFRIIQKVASMKPKAASVA